MYTNTQEVLHIMRHLLTEIEGSDNGRYPKFDPTTIEVVSTSNIRYQSSETVGTLTLALRWLAVTIYHYLTGRSEINNDQVRMDGYAPLEDEALWQILGPMLGGQVASVPMVANSIKGYSKQKTRKIRAQRRARLKKLPNTVFGPLGNTIGSIKRSLLGAIRSVFSGITAQRLVRVCKLMTLATIIWYWIFNWPTIDPTANAAWTIVFFIGVCAISSSLNDDDINARGAIILFILAMAIYASGSFANDPDFAHNNTEPGLVLVSRNDDTIKARFAHTKDDSMSIMNDPFIHTDMINHFKYRMVNIMEELYREKIPTVFQITTDDNVLTIPAHYAYQLALSEAALGGKTITQIPALRDTAEMRIRQFHTETEAALQLVLNLNKTSPDIIFGSNRSEIHAVFNEKFQKEFLLQNLDISYYFEMIKVELLPTLNTQRRE